MAEKQIIPEESFEDNNPESQDSKALYTELPVIDEKSFQPSDLTPKPEPDMEVHHHPDLHHRKKNWKEYFLEFLMIFLAVTLGFFAENLREHFTDRTKEKEYMHGMVSDLKADTLFFNFIIHLNNTQRKGCDSLADLLANPPLNSETVALAYALYLKYTWNYYNVAFHTATYSQLANGGLRLISDNEVIKGIADYNGWAILMNSMEADFRHLHSSINDNSGKKIFDSYYYRNLQDSLNMNLPDSTSIEFLTYPTEKIISSITLRQPAKLASNDETSMTSLRNDLGAYRSYLIFYNTNVKTSKESAKKLIHLIESKYNFE